MEAQEAIQKRLDENAAKILNLESEQVVLKKLQRDLAKN